MSGPIYDPSSHPNAGADRRKWIPMTVRNAGKLSDLVLGGGGKLTNTGTDPGESKKVMGGGD